MRKPITSTRLAVGSVTLAAGLLAAGAATATALVDVNGLLRLLDVLDLNPLL